LGVSRMVGDELADAWRHALAVSGDVPATWDFPFRRNR
jgi:hypothetical protein